MEKYSILIVEDDPHIREGLADALTMCGYAVESAADGNVGWELMQGKSFDLMILDIVLPHKNGIELLQGLRGKGLSTPVIMLTAKGEEEDKVRCLKGGADDYVVKPFSFPELLARIGSVLRRAPQRVSLVQQNVKLCDGYVDIVTHTVYFRNQTTVLTTREFELLMYLAARSGRIVSKNELLIHVWKVDPSRTETRSIDTTLAHLRRKLGESNNHLIQTYKGSGYCFNDI